MANEKLTQLPSLSAASGNTLFYVVDVSDPTDDPTGSSKQITRDNILKNISGLTASTISATTYFNLPTYDYEIHVSTVDGNDTTGNGDLLNPVATITKALTLLTGSRKTIIVHPGTYSENVTVANTNTTISTSELTGANTLLSGTLTIGTLGSGTRISGLKMSNLVISGTAQAYISNCTVDTQVTKSSSGFVEIINSEMQCISGIQISGSGTIIINGNKNVGISVSNASAQVIIKGCNSVVTPSASAGNLAIVDCIVTALGGNGITITGALTTLTLINSQVLVTAGNNVAPISVAGIYTIINTIYDKPSSTLTGTSTNSIDYFQYINADKFITQGGTSSQYVMGDGSLSNGFTGGTVSGGTIFQSGLTANTIYTDYIDFNTTPTVPNPTGGTLYFDSNENALSYKPITNQNDVTVNLGQETLIKIYNGLGSQINNGQVVHITGATGGVPTVALANASKLGTIFTDSLAQSTGVATHDIPSGEYGFITFFGIVRDLNTTAFTAGQEVFLSDTVDGGLTNDPNNIAFTSRVSTVGYCLESNATTGKILVSITNENPLQSLTQQEVNVLLGNTISTGTYSFTGITTASTTTINVAPMKGWVVYNTYEYSTSPLVLNIYYSGGTNVGITNIGSADATYLLVNSGGTLYQQTTFPSPQERRENIFLGKVVHPNRSTILAVNNTVDYDVSPMSALRDLWSPIKIINDGVLVTPNGSNLNINTSSGTLWSNGIGWTTNELNPNSVTISAKVPASFFYRTQTGGTSSAVTVIDPTKYDVGGVITSVGGAASNDATNQRVYLYPTGTINVLYGQTVYNTLAQAVSGIQSETFVVYPNAKTTGVLIGIISVRNDIVDDGQPLTNTDYAIFTPVSKFGELLGGTAGLSTTTLQQAYNNSTTPEIITNSTLGPVSIKNGSGTADNVTSLFETLNSGGTVTMFVRADGSISANTITATTISATTYQNLPVDPDTYVTGFTYNDNEFVIKQNNGQPDLTVVINSVTGWTVNGDLNVTGNTTLDGLTATTISATTYQNLPVDPNYYVTAFTYNNNVFTIKQTGQSDLTALINTVTGWTVNGELTVTGNTSLQAFTGTSGTINGDLTVTGNTTVRGNLVVSGNTGVNWFSSNTSSDLVRITQTGTGNAFVVEDSTNPDSTPFVINNNGKIGIGTTTVTSSAMIDINSSDSPNYGIYFSQFNTSFMPVTGIYSVATQYGIQGLGVNNAGSVGVYGIGNDNGEADAGSKFYGGHFIGTGGQAYSVKLQDGTEGVGKFLYSVDADGSANWTSQLSGTSATINGPLTVTGNTTLRATTASTLNVTGNTIVDGTISGGTMVITTTPTNENTNTQILSRNPTTGAIEYVDASSTPIGTYNYGISYTMFTGNYMV